MKEEFRNINIDITILPGYRSDRKRNILNECEIHGYYACYLYKDICPTCRMLENYPMDLKLNYMKSLPGYNELSHVNLIRFCEKHGDHIVCSYNKKLCPECQNEFVYVKCENFKVCGKEIEVNKYEYDEKHNYSCCWNCAVTGPGYCSNENCPHKDVWQEKRTANSMCLECSRNQLIKMGELGRIANMTPGYCTNKECKTPDVFQEKRSGNGYCYECSKKQMADLVEKNRESGNCTECGKFNDVRDQNGWGFECECHYDHNFQFTYKNFINKENVKCYFDKKKEKYVLWNKYKTKFKAEQNDRCLEEFDEITTFRTQESDNWTGAKGTFEESLIESGLTWIVYVKYYIDGESGFNPLVIGKTGSKLVNVKGTDVSFDYDEDGGPARQFLIEEGYEWNKTQVGVIGCETEK